MVMNLREFEPVGREASKEYECVSEDITCDRAKESVKVMVEEVERIVEEVCAYRDMDARIFFEHVLKEGLNTMCSELEKIITHGGLPELRRAQLTCRFIYLTGRETWIPADLNEPYSIRIIDGIATTFHGSQDRGPWKLEDAQFEPSREGGEWERIKESSEQSDDTEQNEEIRKRDKRIEFLKSELHSEQQLQSETVVELGEVKKELRQLKTDNTRYRTVICRADEKLRELGFKINMNQCRVEKMEDDPKWPTLDPFERERSEQ